MMHSPGDRCASPVFGQICCPKHLVDTARYAPVPPAGGLASHASYSPSCALVICSEPQAERDMT
eukprot:scaffold270219_cov40-Tisochrysis_lutea.AAC.1